MNFVVPEHIIQKLKERSQKGDDTPCGVIQFKSVDTGNSWKTAGHVDRVNISRSVGEADVATIEMDNKLGIYSPETKDELSPWRRVLTPNTEVNITLGYGAYQVQCFKGFIDTTNLVSHPSRIALDCRSRYKLALDNYFTVMKNGVELHTMVYDNCTIEEIFVDLALKAGWESYEIYIEEDPDYRTKITLEEFEVSRETYADAFTRLSEISQFEIVCDEYGYLKLLHPTISQPAVVNQFIEFTYGIDTYQLFGVSNIIEGSEHVTDETGIWTYVRNEDYYLYWNTVYDCIEIFRPTGSRITPGGRIMLSYVYPAYEFLEGETIMGVQYTLSDDDAYGKVIVYGEKKTITLDGEGNEIVESEVIEGHSSYQKLGQTYYGNTILKLYTQPHKTLMIDSNIAQTVEQCEILADRALLMCAKRYRSCRHTSIAVPYLIIGDTIQVYESSTAVSEAYRITAMNITLDTTGFVMDVESYHVGSFKVWRPGGMD